MSEEKLTPERAVRLLRAKGAELEQQVLYGDVRGKDDLHSLVADVALIAQLLADHIEISNASQVLADAHIENLIERVYALENGLEAGIEIRQPIPWGPDHPDYDEMGQ